MAQTTEPAICRTSCFLQQWEGEGLEGGLREGRSQSRTKRRTTGPTGFVSYYCNGRGGNVATLLKGRRESPCHSKNS